MYPCWEERGFQKQNPGRSWLFPFSVDAMINIQNCGARVPRSLSNYFSNPTWLPSRSLLFPTAPATAMCPIHSEDSDNGQHDAGWIPLTANFRNVSDLCLLEAIMGPFYPNFVSQ